MLTNGIFLFNTFMYHSWPQITGTTESKIMGRGSRLNMNAALTPQNVVYTQALCMSPRSLAEAGGPTPACPSQHPAGGAASLSNNRPSSFLRIIKQEKC